MSHADIRIGTLAGQGLKTAPYLKQLIPLGFESFQINFFKEVPAGLDLRKLAGQVRGMLAEAPALPDVGGPPIVSSVGIFGNPLENRAVVRQIAQAIDAAPLFGCKLFCGFTGAISGKPVPESLKAFKRVWGPLARRAADRGVRIAFENCDMGGRWESASWNIAHAPAAWELMFHELPADNVGLEWEPTHQMVSLVDPLPQLRQWVHKVFHIHGKDATIDWATLRTHGLRGGKRWVYHRTPGFGDTNWTDVISVLRLAKWQGSIDIEGWHDPVYRGELEMTGQVRGLRYLQECRGGAFVPYPRV